MVAAALLITLTPASLHAEDYSWNATAWGLCSESCGDGIQSRSVFCRRDSDGAPVDAVFCDAGTMPAAVQPCTDTSGCTYSWNVTAWGLCSESCGDGIQSRSVFCRRDSDGTPVDAVFCDAGTMPAAVQPCTEKSGCIYSQEALDQAVAKATAEERKKWDVNGDGKIGMEEAVRALQMVSGMRNE